MNVEWHTWVLFGFLALTLIVGYGSFKECRKRWAKATFAQCSVYAIGRMVVWFPGLVYIKVVSPLLFSKK